MLGLYQMDMESLNSYAADTRGCDFLQRAKVVPFVLHRIPV